MGVIIGKGFLPAMVPGPTGERRAQNAEYESLSCPRCLRLVLKLYPCIPGLYNFHGLGHVKDKKPGEKKGRALV